jgi:hypothetical protein
MIEGESARPIVRGDDAGVGGSTMDRSSGSTPHISVRHQALSLGPIAFIPLALTKRSPPRPQPAVVIS